MGVGDRAHEDGLIAIRSVCVRGPMMLMRVDRWDVRRDGAFTEAALLHKVRALGYDAVTRAYPGGAMISPPTGHRSRVQAVVSGLVKITINSEAAILSSGDLVFVPPEATPRLEILGPAGATCVEGILIPDAA